MLSPSFILDLHWVRTQLTPPPPDVAELLRHQGSNVGLIIGAIGLVLIILLGVAWSYWRS